MAGRQTSPGIALSPSRLCPPHLRPRFPCRYWALRIIALSPSMAASYAISVRQASALPAASFRSHLTVNTLAVRLTVPPAGSVGDLHPQVSAPCRAHNEKTRPNRRSSPGAGEASRVATPIGRLDKHSRPLITARLFSGVPTRCRCHGRTRHGLLLFGRPLQGGFTCLPSPVHTRILQRPPPVRRFRSSGRRAHPAL